MRESARHRSFAKAMRAAKDDDQRELALLEEFARCPSVAALAGVIAERLGPRANPKALIEEAGLSAATNDRVTQRN